MTVYRRNPLLMTVMGANPGGPAFIVADSVTGRVMYTKRATGVGSQAINSCATVAHRLASRNGRSYIVFLDMSNAKRGGQISIPWARALGITEEVHPDGSVTRGNPPRRKRSGESEVDSMIGAAWARFMSGVQVSVMEIPKIFRDIKLEMSGGMTLEDAVRSVGNRYRVNSNPGIGAAIVAGATGALVNHALQSNPVRRRRQFSSGRSGDFVVVDSADGKIVRRFRYTIGDASGPRAAEKHKRLLTSQHGRPFLSFWDIKNQTIGLDRISMDHVDALLRRDRSWDEMRLKQNPHLEGGPCSACSGSLAYQGTFGNREHYRCRNCGLDFNTPVTRRRRFRGWKKTCGHGRITNTCEICRGRRARPGVKPCPHGIAGGGVRCVACQRLYRRGGPIQNNPAIARSWNGLKSRPRLAILEFAGIPYEQAQRLAGRPWEALPPQIREEVSKGWQENPKYRVRHLSPEMESRESVIRARGLKHALKKAHQEAEKLPPRFTAPRSSVEVERYRENPGPRGKRRMTMTIERFADWVKSKRDPAMWKAFLAKFRGYEKWTHGAKAQKVTVEWVDTPGVNGLWITYDGGKQPESTYIMPKGSPRKGAWKHPWDTMPDIKHDPEAKIVITKLRGQSKITDFYHK